MSGWGGGGLCFLSAVVGAGVAWVVVGVADCRGLGGLMVVGDVVFVRAASRVARSAESSV